MQAADFFFKENLRKTNAVYKYSLISSILDDRQTAAIASFCRNQ